MHLLRSAWRGAILLLLVSGAASFPLNATQQDEISPVHLVHELRKRSQGIAYCVGDEMDVVLRAQNEAVAILNFAKDRLQVLANILQQNPVPAYISMSDADRTLFQTWESFYGQVYFGRASNKNTAALNRVQTMQCKSFFLFFFLFLIAVFLRLPRFASLTQQNTALAATIHGHLSSPFQTNLQIWCNDYFMMLQDPAGNINLGYYWDNHAWTPQTPQLGEWVAFQNFKKCDQMPTTTAYTWHPSFRDETLVVLCPNHMSDWKAHYYSSDFPSSHHNNNNQIPDGGKRLDDVWKYLPSTLIHEFTHSLVLTQGRTNYQEPGNANSLQDLCLNNGNSAYQWECIHQLAIETPGKSTSNSDTFALFATAIYMNSNDWSTGFSAKLGFIGPRLP